MGLKFQNIPFAHILHGSWEKYNASHILNKITFALHVHHIFSALFITQSTQNIWNVNQIIDYKYINRMKSIDYSFRYVVLICIRQVRILIMRKPW